VRTYSSAPTPDGAPLKEVQADESREEHDARLDQEAVQCFEALVNSLETPVNPVEAGFHLPAVGDEFGSRFDPVRAQVGVEALEAAVDLLVEVIEAFVAPLAGHRLHDGTIADKTLRVGPVSARSLQPCRFRRRSFVVRLKAKLEKEKSWARSS
jgi:hypothetical protein